ncbi:MAG: OsmC family protein [Actinobacteria bacterium]|nr:OsmC family protein [Actinomycetota bacterium]
MLEIKNKVSIFKNSLIWEGERKGIVFSDNKPGFSVATPPEFKGHAGIWSPEDLFIASVNTCIMTTFLYYAERNKLEFISYKSDAEGVLEFLDNKFVFSEIRIKPLVGIKKDTDISKAKNLMELSEKNCLISNSIKPQVKVTPEINIL